jgi:hypothetical protein
MSSRRRPPPSKALLAKLEKLEKLAQLEQHGLTTLRPEAFWLPENTDWSMVDALYVFDQFGIKEPLLKLLRARGDIYLADFLQRYDLKRKLGRQQTPEYDLSDIERRLAMAVKDVREHGVTLAAAADHWGLSIPTLEMRLAGRRGSSRARHRP